MKLEGDSKEVDHVKEDNLLIDEGLLREILDLLLRDSPGLIVTSLEKEDNVINHEPKHQRVCL